MIFIEDATQHSEQRIFSRLKEIGLDVKTISSVFQKAKNFADYKAERNKDYGVRLFTIKDIHGIPWSDKSNGDEIWSIIRNKNIITVMFRRSTQPATPESLRVDKIVKM